MSVILNSKLTNKEQNLRSSLPNQGKKEMNCSGYTPSWHWHLLISRWEMLIVCSPSYLLALVMRWAVMGSPLPVSGARPEIRHQFLLSFIIPSAGPNIRTTLVIVTQGIRRKTGEQEWHFCQTLLCYLWLKLQRL